MRFRFYIPLLLLVLIVCGCDMCNKPKKNLAQWPSGFDNSTVASGNSLGVQLTATGEGDEIDSIGYYLNEKYIAHAKNFGEAWTWQTARYPVGTYSIKGIVYAKGKTEIHTAQLTLLSDITPKTIPVKVKAVYPHSNKAFTEGLLIDKGQVYEGTGMVGKSFVYRYALGSKAPETLVTLPDPYFGEGICLYDNKLVQLTWQSGVGMVYDAKTWQKIKEFRYGGEGWGMSMDSTYLIMSDGSHRLFFLDKETFQPVKTLEVCDNKGRVMHLNELEVVGDAIYSNIWQTDLIAHIDLKTGKVLEYINCEGLLTAEEIEANGVDVLNGIAWDKSRNALYVTGKYWPKIFEIQR